jgi:hypothetical protein
MIKTERSVVQLQVKSERLASTAEVFKSGQVEPENPREWHQQNTMWSHQYL